MKRRILLFTCLLAGLSIILTTVVLNNISYRNLVLEARQQLKAESELVGAAVNMGGLAYLESLSPDMETRFSLISPKGRVIFDSRANLGELGDHSDRPEVAEALATGRGESFRFSGTIGKRTVYYALRLRDGDVLRAAITVDSVYMDLFRLLPFMIVAVAAIALLALIVGGKVTRAIVEPINKLNLNAPEENAVYEELSPLLSRMKRQNDVIDAQMSEIRQKQAEFTAITDNMREGLLVLDQDAYVLTCNKSAMKLLQSRIDPSVRQNALAFNRSDAFSEAIGKAAGGLRSESVLRVGAKSIQLIATPVQGRDYEPEGPDPDMKGIILFLQDVTEREDREKLRREFTANVSHELKTPLTSISGYAEIIASGLAKGDDVPRFAANIYNETKRLITLIGDIMTLSRLDDKGTAIANETVDLRGLAEEVIERLKDMAYRKNITVTLSGGEASVQGLRQALDESLYNLVENAVKYNRPDGKVEVSVEDGADAAILTVKDTGAGIPPSEQERVFERFYRLEKSRNNAIEGTGLGLSIVKHGVQLHGGEIFLDSDGASGTTVTIKLPKG
ncbi:MAG: ATP-binding protein [Clostridiales Family XIII bacterium]|jgi:two-component system phosphate regulon sensor histidine kinase PhoR|nr:ATP-binding protein [Clostridiales Family XIII bacterium]